MAIKIGCNSQQIVLHKNPTNTVFVGFLLIKSAPPRRSQITKKEDSNHVMARQRLEHLVKVLRRENNINSSNVVDKNDGMPRARLKIIISTPAEKLQLVAKHGDAIVKVNILNRGQALSIQGLLLRSERNEYCQTVSFGPEDYEQNEELARFLFTRPGRCRPCARCQVYSRTMGACRVLRKHTNLDCDWSSLFSEGFGYVDDQINILDPDALKNASESIAENSKTDEAQREIVQPTNAVPIAESAEVVDPDPSEFFQLATTTLTQANELVDAAKSYSTCPLRLSKKFIEASFPIDKSDGHFLYCVMCGLSGDLLCCDGCPNVVHAKCISLVDLPEGDWFCEKCTTKKSGNLCNLALNPDDSKFSSIYSCDENDSVYFHESKINTLLSQLDHLKSSRPAQKNKENATENAENSAVTVSQGKHVSTDTNTERKLTASNHVGNVVVDGIKEVDEATITEKITFNDVKSAKKKAIDVSGGNQIRALPIVPVVPLRSMRTRSHRMSEGKVSYRPSIVKRRRIDRAAV